MLLFVCEALALLWTVASLAAKPQYARTHAHAERSNGREKEKSLKTKHDHAVRASPRTSFNVATFKWFQFNFHGQALHQIWISRGGAACKGSCPVQIPINKDYGSKDTTFGDFLVLLVAAGAVYEIAYKVQQRNAVEAQDAKQNIESQNIVEQR